MNKKPRSFLGLLLATAVGLLAFAFIAVGFQQRDWLQAAGGVVILLGVAYLQGETPEADRREG